MFNIACHWMVNRPRILNSAAAEKLGVDLGMNPVIATEMIKEITFKM
jgi:hypothetical protein